MGVPRRTPKEVEAACLIAYEKYCQRKSLRDIAAEMAGPPHFCGGHTTARRWVQRGHELVTLDEDENGRTFRDPTRKRPMRRDSVSDALDSLFVTIEQEVHAGIAEKRLGARKLQLQILLSTAQIEGLRRAPELPRAKNPDGSKRPVTPGELFDSLNEMRGEFDAFIESQLPDRRIPDAP